MKKLKEALKLILEEVNKGKPKNITEAREMALSAITRIHNIADKALALTKTEALLSELEVEAEFEDIADDGDDQQTFLTAGVSILGCCFHLDAIQVADAAGNEAKDEGENELDRLNVASENASNMLLTMNRKKYVVWMHPYEQ